MAFKFVSAVFRGVLIQLLVNTWVSKNQVVQS